MNGNLNRLTSVWTLLATNTQLACWVSEDDINTFLQRVEQEGLTFLTTTLPVLDKALLAGMRDRCLGPIRGFKLQNGSVRPRFLSRAWDAIFTKDGTYRVLEKVPAEAVLAIRQLTCLFYKLELPYTDAQIAASTSAFYKAEEDLRNLVMPEDNAVIRVAQGLIRRLLAGVSPFDIRPKHGSGASACGVPPHKRYKSFRFIPRLNAVFPYAEYFYASFGHLCDEHNMMSAADVEEDPPAKIVFVPKDSRGPRIISEECRELMYIQQGLRDLLYRTVEDNSAINDQVGFTDQRRNQMLAQIASIDGSYATLDLKEASDRVSVKLLCKLFPLPWIAALLASRSARTVFPDGREVIMHKFAPMGSAVCFPVEALCFWSLSLAATLVFTYRKDGLSDVYKYIDRLFTNKLLPTDVKISVYGDDVIVPVDATSAVIETLESVGLLVNQHKSYWSGPFRESCGGDYFMGMNVAPIRWKHLISIKGDSASRDDYHASKFRTAKMLNNIIGRYGYGNVGKSARTLFESWYGPVPVSNWFRVAADGTLLQLSNGLALYGPTTDVPPCYRRRENSEYHHCEYRIPVAGPVTLEVDLDSWSELLRWFSARDPEQTLARVALPKRHRYKYGWTPL